MLSYAILFVMYKWSVRWIWLLFSLFIISVLFGLSFFCRPFEFHITLNHEFIRLIIILLLIIPICYQVAKSVLYSAVLKSYFIQEVNRISKEYTTVKLAMEQSDSELIPKVYESAFVHTSFAKNHKADLQLTMINDILREQLERISQRISLPILIQSYFKTPPLKENQDLPALADEDVSVTVYTGDYYPSTDIAKIKRCVKSYEHMNPKPKIVDYCSANEINESTFRNYRNSYFKKNRNIVNIK